MHPRDLVVLALASFRATRLVTSDVIAEKPRNAVIRWALTNKHPKVDQLVSCNYCAGWWVSVAVLAAWRVPLLRPIVRAFAVAGAQSLLSTADVRMNDGL